MHGDPSGTARSSRSSDAGSQLHQADPQKSVVHGVVGSGEVEGQKDILLGAGAVRGVPAARLREVPAVLDLLDEAADVVLHRPPLPEADLLC